MHLIHLLLTLTPGLVCSTVLKRIVGGELATTGQFNSIVALIGHYGPEFPELDQFCGGSLLNPTTVLTAAHCVNWVMGEPREFSVRAGSLFWNESGEVARVARYEMHPAYKNGDNDFAILKLDTPIAESSTIGYAQLPAEDQADPEAGTIATVAGWGLDREAGNRFGNLWWVDIPVIDRKECEAAYSVRNSTITDQMWCAGTKEGGKGDCTRDSGGPVTIDHVLTGVVSFSFGCADPLYPSVYARVSKAIPFITPLL